jgi:hypothetical protein
MSATSQSIEQLVQDLSDLNDVCLAIGSGGDGLFSAFLRGEHSPFRTFTMSWHTLSDTVWLHLEGEQWELFSRLGAIQRVYFDRRPDGHAPEYEALSVRLSGPGDGPSWSFIFGHLYDEQGKPIAERFVLWEELRAKYGGRNEMRVENGRLIPLAEGES